MISQIAARVGIKTIVLSSVLVLSGCRWYQTPEMIAAESFHRGQYHRAYTALERMARQGNVRAQYALGYMNFYGLGTAQDRDLARSWIRKAAMYKYPPAMAAFKMMTQDVYYKEHPGSELPILPAHERAEAPLNDDFPMSKNFGNVSVEFAGKQTQSASSGQVEVSPVDLNISEADEVELPRDMAQSNTSKIDTYQLPVVEENDNPAEQQPVAQNNELDIKISLNNKQLAESITSEIKQLIQQRMKDIAEQGASLYAKNTQQEDQ